MSSDPGSPDGTVPTTVSPVDTVPAETASDTRPDLSAHPTVTRIEMANAMRSPRRWVGDLRSAPPAERWLALAGVVGIVLAFALVVVAYGVLPGHLPDPIDFYSGSGVATCTAQNFPAHLFACPDIGYPSQYRAPFGQPVLWVSGFAQWIGADPVNGTRIAWLVALVFGFFGARRLLARVTDIGWLAWLGVLAFLLAPIVSGQGGYGALQLGFVLVPAYLLVDLRLAEGLAAGLGARRIAWRVAALLVVRTIALMMDPYSFFIATVGVVAIWLVWAIRLLRRRAIRTLVIGAALVLASFIVAYLIYSRSVDTSGFSVEGLDYFRGAGVDLYGLVVPSTSVWWASLTGLHHNIGPLEAYSDGHNLYDVYLGVPLLVLAVLGLVIGLRRGRAVGVAVVAGLAGAVVFVLGLGPSVRIDDFRVVSPSAAVTYTMPASAATFSSPWSWLYQHIPGISNMRAVWRWELGVRLAAVVLAVVALSWWVSRTSSWRTRWIPALVAVLIVVESIGNIPVNLKNQQNYLGDARAVQTVVTDPLAALVTPGQRAILYGPGGVSPGSNDYMANFLCSATALRCYNAGGDKALGNALVKMPAAARQVIAGHAALGDKGVEPLLRSMFASGQLDVVVLVNFDLAAQAGNWPPSGTIQNKAVLAGRKMFTGGGFTRVETPFFTVIKPGS